MILDLLEDPVPWKRDNTKKYTAAVDGIKIELGISQLGLTPVDVVQNLRNVNGRAIGDLSGNLGLKIFLIRNMKKILNDLGGNIYSFY